MSWDLFFFQIVTVHLNGVWFWIKLIKLQASDPCESKENIDDFKNIYQVKLVVLLVTLFIYMSNDKWANFNNVKAVFTSPQTFQSVDKVLPRCLRKGSHSTFHYTPGFNEAGGISRLSVRPSVCLWTESCPLCIFNNTHQIHFIFAHLIKQLQKVCHV